MSYQIAIDIGGTFTDLYLRSSDGEVESVKVPTTPEDFSDGFFNALRKAAELKNESLSELLAASDSIVHGTTVATNAVIEDEMSTTAFITTDGFRDILQYREGGKEDPFDYDVSYPTPYIDRYRRYTVRERVNAEGEVITPLGEDDVISVIQEIADSDVEAVAVCLLWSHVNPIHEELIGELLDEHLPEVQYSLAHEVNPIIREYRRAISTAIDASLIGPIDEYINSLKTRLKEYGYEKEPLIITANGGVMHTDELTRSPIWAVDSGPTMLPVAAKAFASDELDRDDVIALDMGGTSLDMGVVNDGTIPRTREATIKNDLLGIEKVDVRSIGSGGGSIAWVDEGGLLHVGPESAGADPGPACYLRGGEEPTVTDAALVLGYLNEDYFLGGDMEIAKAPAQEALEQIADGLNTSLLEAAYSIYLTANQNMVNGINEITVERGIDPRRYSLAGGGGGLGMFAVSIARDLGVNEILLPSQAGVVSAIGGLLSDIQHDFSASTYTTSQDFDYAAVNETLETLEAKSQDFIDRVGGGNKDSEIVFHAEGRYPQQVWELEITLPARRVEIGDESELVERFHKVHEETFGFSTEEPVEFLYWRAEAIVETGGSAQDFKVTNEKIPLTAAQHDERSAYFDGRMYDAPAYNGDSLAPGHSFAGPAFVESSNTTIVLPPDSSLRVTESGNYRINP